MASITVALHEAIELSPKGNIGLENYPIFDESYRAGLNAKIIDHYYNQEIGMETIAMFRLALGRRMREVMPRFNQLYISEKLVIDPLNTISMETVNDSESSSLVNSEGESSQANETTGKNDQTTASNGTGSNVSDTESSGRTVQHNFPQTALDDEADYADSAVDTSSRARATSNSTEQNSGSTNGVDESNSVTDGSDKSTTKADNIDSSTSKTKGYQGSQAVLLMQFRESFLNIDLDVIESLADCFMGVWNTNDSYTQNNRRGYLY